jgi:hypothetical protein
MEPSRGANPLHTPRMAVGSSLPHAPVSSATQADIQPLLAVEWEACLVRTAQRPPACAGRLLVVRWEARGTYYSAETSRDITRKWQLASI